MLLIAFPAMAVVSVVVFHGPAVPALHYLLSFLFGTLVECYRRMLHGAELGSASFPTTWMYQRYLKSHSLDTGQRDALRDRCPGIEFLDWERITEGDEPAESGDWDMIIRARADTEADIRGQINDIEAVAVPSS